MSGVATLGKSFESADQTPSTALRLYLSRIEQHNVSLNAVVTMNSRAAVEAAASDERWRNGQPISLLDGVPFLVKDDLWTAGVRTTWGSEMFRDFIPDRDDYAVERLRRAGAVLIGKTNTPEFALLGATLSRLFGATRNALDPTRTAGGSSGGSAAALRSGMAAFALGTDTQGSVRRPAGHNGVVGFRPTPGRIPYGGGFPNWFGELQVVGPLTSCVDDLNVVMKVLSGPDPRDPLTQSFAGWPEGEGGGRRLSVKFAAEVNSLPVDARILRSTLDAVDRLGRAGHTVTRGTLSVDLEFVGALMQACLAEGLLNLAAEHPDFGFEMEPYNAARTLSAAGVASAKSSGKLANPDAKIEDFRRSAMEQFEGADVIVTPTTSAQPWSFDLPYPCVIDGRPAEPRDHACFTGWVSAARLPAISVPVGVDDDGLPIGIQVIGRPGQDTVIVALAAEIERLASTA